MPQPYSAGLRERVLGPGGAAGRAGPGAWLAALFGVDATTLHRWRQQARAEGRRAAWPPRGGPAPRLDAAAPGTLRGPARWPRLMR